MTTNVSILGDLAEEISIDTSTLTGGVTWDIIGNLEHHPVQIIFDNRSLATVEIGNNNDTIWKTFDPGTAVLLDMRANHGIADNFLFRKGMPFYARGTPGVGTFSISYTYALVTTI